MGSPTGQRAAALPPRAQPWPGRPRTGQRPPATPRRHPGTLAASLSERLDTSLPVASETVRAILPFLPHRHTLFPLGRPRRNFRSSPGNPAILLPEVARPAVRNPEASPALQGRSCHVAHSGTTPCDAMLPPTASGRGMGFPDVLPAKPSWWTCVLEERHSSREFFSTKLAVWPSHGAGHTSRCGLGSSPLSCFIKIHFTAYVSSAQYHMHM